MWRRKKTSSFISEVGRWVGGDSCPVFTPWKGSYGLFGIDIKNNYFTFSLSYLKYHDAKTEKDKPDLKTAPERNLDLSLRKCE